jgi:hypothetical protein
MKAVFLGFDDRKCPNCGKDDNATLQAYDRDWPTVTWCACGRIRVVVESGQSVVVERA